MKLWRIRGREHGLKNGVQIFGQGLGSYGPQQTMFIVPIKGQDRPVDELAWGVKPSFSQKPMLVANTDDSLGVILFLTSYNRPGKSIGRLFVAADGGLSNVTLIGHGIGGLADGSVTWEEALFAVQGSATFVVRHTGPPDALVLVDGWEVDYQELSQDEIDRQVDAELVRLNDPRIARWKAPDIPG